MSQFLTHEEIIELQAGIRAEFKRLMALRIIVPRPAAKQWQLLKNCFDVLIGEPVNEFLCDRFKRTQYKFEVEDRLRRYYMRVRTPVSFIFSLRDEGEALRMGLVYDGYPSWNGYVLLIAYSLQEEQLIETRQRVEFIERLIAEAIDVEWQVYMRLPNLDLSILEPYFIVDGAAYNRIKFFATRHHEREWIITNPLNPSTHRLISVSTKQISSNEIHVKTQEYWYLRWWDSKKGEYAQITYRETNRQTYILKQLSGKWLIEQNIYPPPRVSTPHRRRPIIG